MTGGKPTAMPGRLTATGLRCEYHTDPVGLDVARPRLTWTLESDHCGVMQGAYRVLVAASPTALREDRGDLWDSGCVESDRSVHVEYAGVSLRSHQPCWWKVRVWDEDDAASPCGRILPANAGPGNTPGAAAGASIALETPALLQ